jgi:hypothetical protein
MLYRLSYRPASAQHSKPRRESATETFLKRLNRFVYMENADFWRADRSEMRKNSAAL